MVTTTREQLLLETLTVVADTLVDDFDIVEFLNDLVERCAAIFDAVDVGIVLADPHGNLIVMASTSERMHLIETLQLSAGDGPCMESFTTGTAVTAGTLDDLMQRWPAFAEGVDESGYQSVHAVPLRLRQKTIGSLNFFSDKPGELGPADVRAAQTIADVATVGLVQERAAREASLARDHLQHALKSRVLIEQAKGVIPNTRNVDMETAWVILRDRAHSHQTRVSDMAQDIIDRTLVMDEDPQDSIRALRDLISAFTKPGAAHSAYTEYVLAHAASILDELDDTSGSSAAPEEPTTMDLHTAEFDEPRQPSVPPATP